MSDNPAPQPDPDPERDGAPAPAPDAPVSASASESGAEPVSASAESVVANDALAEGSVENDAPEPDVSSSAHDGRIMWVVAAVVCAALGVLASVLGAHTVARNDGAHARQDFQQGSTAVASTLTLAMRHEQQLTVSASTFFADHPHAKPAEVATWTAWARTTHRYPELDALGFRTRGHASPAQRLSTDTGLSVYTPVSSARGSALAIETPVYRGYVTPRSVFGRRAASVGWLREVLIPGVVLEDALAGHPGYALQLRYHASAANAAFASGAPKPGVQSATIALHGGWSATSFGPAATTSVFNDGNALALLIGGCLLSVLLGGLVFVLGAGGEDAEHVHGPTTPKIPTPEPREVPDEDLYDALTGLPNRALTLDRAERMVARAGRDSGMLAGALFVDIDRLQDVNEKLGQAAGDQLLRIVGERLEGVVRAHDTVGRLGGDEFVVLVESAARGVRLDSLARRMIESLHKPVELEDFGPSFVLTASIGVAFGRYATPEDMLRDARLALASAKAAGKDRYTLFNANMRTVIEGRAVLEAELNAALAQEQFYLLYEPVFDLGARRVVDLEAVIRWRHPTQGVVEPADFIPLAQETGLIVPIGRWALEEACTRAAAWSVAGHRVGVSVKVSAQQLNRDGFVTDVRRALQQSGVEPSLLILRIAETTVMRDVAASTSRLGELKRLGVRLAIDDFGGGGYANHADLRQMQLDFLRVDRSSLAASEDENYRRWLLESIFGVGRDLSLTVIAAGIETAEDMSAIQAMGCTMAQGSFLGQPTPGDAVESLFGAGLPTVGPDLTSPALASLANPSLANNPPAVVSPADSTASTPGPERTDSHTVVRPADSTTPPPESERTDDPRTDDPQSWS
jgi:diguanylate cyclase (GGDEF)-like protein